MGYVSLLGTLYCMLATVMVLVALFTLIEKRGGQPLGPDDSAPGDAGKGGE